MFHVFFVGGGIAGQSHDLKLRSGPAQKYVGDSFFSFLTASNFH